MTVLNLQVAASSDDARESGAGVVNTTSATMALSSGSAWLGFRFNNVTIPQGATINTAVLQVYVDATSADDPDVDIYCEDQDDAATFTTAANSISTRTTTTAKTTWTATAVGTGFVSAPGIASAVQEVINRAGWVSGNDLVVLFDSLSASSLTIRAYDSLPAEAAKLDIDYSSGAAAPDTTPFVRSTGGGGRSVIELWLTDDYGQRIADQRGHSFLKSFVSLTASRAVNEIGKFTLHVPASFDDSLLRPDRMVQLWRGPVGRLSLWRVYFIRRWIFETRGSQEVITIEGPDINDLLRRRIVAAFAGSAQASKTDFADDMMKEVVTQSIADGVAPTPTAGTRVLSNLSIQADLGDGPTITKSFPFDKLLTVSGQGVLSVLAKAAREAGTEVFFDIVPNVVSVNSISFQFQTFTGQPGRDVTDRVVFDQQNGNMRDPKLEYDYSEEENYIYAAGQGEQANRNVQQVYDAVRYGVSQWGRCEGLADARNQSSDDGVREAGRAALEGGRPKIRFSATPVDVSGTRFGRDWDVGYKVRSRYRNREFDTIIRVGVLSVDENGAETIQARLDAEVAVG